MSIAIAATVIRRVCFTCVLLSTAAIAAVAGHYGLNSDGHIVIAVGMFFWGTENVGIILAAWFVGRHGVWKSGGGWARAMLYASAYVCGRMLFDVTSNLLHQRDEPVYDRPFFELPTVLACAWLLIPAFVICRGKLAETRLEAAHYARFTVGSLLAWTGIAALILAWIRFLTVQDFLPKHSLNYMTLPEAIEDFLTGSSAGIPIRVIAIVMVMLSWSGKYWKAPLGLIGAILFDAFASRAFYGGLAQLTGETFDNYLPAGADLRSWGFVAGRNGVAWVAFGGAALTGVRLRRFR